MEEDNQKNIERRKFLKVLSGAAAASVVMATGCGPNAKTSVPKDGGLGEVPKDKMTYRITTNTGDKVSLLGFGCMRWPMKKKAGSEDEEIDQEAVNKLVDYAIEHGVNYFDTSPFYVRGFSETATGIALSRHPRDKYFIATKLSTFPDDRHLRSREGSMTMYEKSFKDLQVDYIDYYLLHATGLGGMKAVKERFYDNGMLDFLLEERKKGRIRNLGWSFHGDLEVFDHLLSLDIKWDFVMIQLNYVDWKHASGWNINAEYLYGELQKRNIPAIVMEPILGGRLAKLSDYLVAQLKQRRPQESAASWAFRFAGSFPNTLTVLSGMTYMENLQENIRTYAPLEPLSNDELVLLEDIAQMFLKYPSVPCTNCQYCMPCPYGIDIPAVFTHYNKCVNEGNVPKTSIDENYAAARRAFLVGYDRSVPRLRQANHCIACNQCVPHCPQRIDIPNEMARIDKFTEQLKQGLTF